MQEASAKPRPELVTVTLVTTDGDGNTSSEDQQIAGGPMKVTDLKAELGVPAESALWVIGKSGNKKQLGDHETHNVKEGDRYEAIGRGGVS